MNYLDHLFTTREIVETDDGFTARLCCNPDHPVYQAHFPDNPITPGACLLQTAGELLQQKTGRPLHLKASKNIKFLSTLIPSAGKEVDFRFSSLTETDTECKAKVVIAGENVVYSKMSLIYSYERL